MGDYTCTESCMFFVATTIMVLSVVMFPLHIAMIVMGAIFKDDCPVENMIPIYVIVAGTVGLFSCFSGCAVAYNEDRKSRIVTIPRQPESPYWHMVNKLHQLVQLFLFAWFIAGNVWIYKTYEPNYADPSSLDFCHKTLYLFAFWVTNSYYILFGLVFGILCCAGIVGNCVLGEPEV